MEGNFNLLISDILNPLQNFAQIINWGKDQTSAPISVVWGNNLHFQFFDSCIPLFTTKGQHCF